MLKVYLNWLCRMLDIRLQGGGPKNNGNIGQAAGHRIRYYDFLHLKR